MTFLDICKAVAARCFVTGRIASVKDQTGDALRVVNKVNEALVEILQVSDDWKFMRATFAFDTVIGQPNYAVAAVTNGRALRSYRFHDRDVGVRQPGQQGFTPMGVWDYEDYELAYIFGVSAPGVPSIVAVGDDKQLWLGATPDRVCNVRGTFMLAPSRMVENTDTPPMPEEYHSAVEHFAVMKFAAEDNLSEVYTSAAVAYAPVLQAMRRTQLEEFHFCGPLA